MDAKLKFRFTFFLLQALLLSISVAHATAVKSLKHSVALYQVAFVDENHILTGDQKGHLSLWRLSTQERLWQSSSLGGAVFSLDSCLPTGHVAIGVGSLRNAFYLGQWKLGEFKLLGSADIRGPALAKLSPQCDLVAVGESGGETLVFETGSFDEHSTPAFTSRFPYQGEAVDFAYSGGWLASVQQAVHRGQANTWEPSKIRLEKITGSKGEQIIGIAAERIEKIQFSGDSSRLLVRAGIGRWGVHPVGGESVRQELIQVIETRSGEVLFERRVSGFANALELSPDGQWLLWGSSSGAIEVIDVDSGHQLWQTHEPQRDLMDLALSPSGAILVGVDFQGRILIHKMMEN